MQADNVLNRYIQSEMPRRNDSSERKRHLDRWRIELGFLTLAVNEWGWLENSPVRKVTKVKGTQGSYSFPVRR